jgi:hypothetical protein
MASAASGLEIGVFVDGRHVDPGAVFVGNHARTAVEVAEAVGAAQLDHLGFGEMRSGKV